MGKAIYETTEVLIKLSAWLLVMLFGWLELRGEEFLPIARELSADATLNVSLAAYYACWVAGLLTDTNMQQHVYAYEPNEGRMPAAGFVTMALLVIPFALMCLVHTYVGFAILLTVFFVVNVASWRYLTKVFLPATVKRSKAAYQNSLFKLERVDLVYDAYLAGRWQLARFAGGAAILAVIDIPTFLGLRSTVQTHIGASSYDLLVAGCVVLFISFMEIWIWIWRLRLRAAVRLLDQLQARYGDLRP